MMVTAIENLYVVGVIAGITFFIFLFIMLILKKFNRSPNLRVLRRKPLFVPGLVLFLIVLLFPGVRIGPPDNLMFNHVVGDYSHSLISDFSVVDIEPYLPRVRVTYSYQIEQDEYITCTVLIYSESDLVTNVSTTLTKQETFETESAHSTFDLPVGEYHLQFSQLVYELDGTPAIRRRRVHVQFEQLQDRDWIYQSITWDQYRVILIVAGFGLFLLGIYVTDHKEDNEVERERYERKKRGVRNYPYWRADRRKEKNRRITERMREKR